MVGEKVETLSKWIINLYKIKLLKVLAIGCVDLSSRAVQSEWSRQRQAATFYHMALM